MPHLDWKTIERKLDAFEIETDRRIATDLSVGNIIHGNLSLRTRPVYHYTDVAGALAILKSGSLWFTERAHLNDPMEVQHGLSVAHQHFDSVTRSSGGFSIDIAGLKAVNELELDTNGFWIACFSQNGDDLGQWRNYADDGRGVCLGFSVDALDVTEFAARLGDKLAMGYSLAVNYQDDYFLDSVGQYVDIGNAFLQEIGLPSQPTEQARRCRERVLRAISRGLYANSIKFKHHSYRQEQEYRLLAGC